MRKIYFVLVNFLKATPFLQSVANITCQISEKAGIIEHKKVIRRVKDYNNNELNLFNI